MPVEQTSTRALRSLRLAPVVALAAACLALSLAGEARAGGTSWVVGTDCATIQACIDLAADGDTVQIPADTYTESVSLVGKAVSLVGAGAATTTVNAAAGRVLTISGAGVDSTVVIEGLTLAGGDVSGGNVCFSGDHTNCGGGVLVTDGATPVFRQVVVDGNRAFEGGGLYADSGVPLEFEEVTFSDNTSVLSGGGAQLEDGASIDGSSFAGNVSENNVGGAIRAGGALDVDDSDFVDNATTGAGPTTIGHGGAVYAFEADVVIESSRFEDNSCAAADCDGGAVYLSTAFVPVSLTLTDTDFVGNSAGRNGGGVAANVVSSGGTGTVDVTGGSFEDNESLGDPTAFADGGGGLNARGDITVDGTSFDGNTAVDAGAGALVRGSASLSNASFANNSARRGGGIAASLFPLPQQLSLSDTDLDSNTADEEGGAVWVELGGASITGGEITDNTATEGNGGGVWVQNGLVTDGATVSGNLAGEDASGFVFEAGNGGGAFVNSGNAELTGGSFENNQAEGSTSPFSEGGGGIYVFDGDLTSDGTVFRGNTATDAIGGGARVNGSTDLTAVLFEDNEAALAGGGVVGAEDLTVSESEFSGNSAHGGNGGGIVAGFFAAAGSTATIADSLFSTNTAANGSGGGISTGLPLTLTGASFVDNSADLGGGGAAASGELTVTDSLFDGNTTPGPGGGLWGSFDPVSVTGSEFSDNIARGNGGGLAANGNLTIDASVFEGNESTDGNGGGASTSGQAHVSGASEIIDNMAAENGGGIWANSGGTVSGGLFSGNTSGGNGGGWASPGGTPVTFSGATFAQNEADADGGAIFTFDLTLVEESTFDRNEAGDQGGAVYVHRGGTITTSLFVGNDAVSLGGAVFGAGESGGAVTKRISVENSTFSGNSAPGAAGLGVDNGTALTLGNITFAENTGSAVDGGTATTVTSANVLVAGTCSGAGTFNSNGGNLESTGNTCGFSQPTDQTGVTVADLNLDGLADNGGPTLTHALLPGSVAIDAGVDAALCPATDQRGVPRIDGACDIGAFEGFVAPIDIHPGSDVNPINTKKKGVVPVAILGVAGLDVTTIDVTTLAFGPAAATPAHELTHPGIYAGHLKDVNGDGYIDLLAHFPAPASGLEPGDTSACVTGSNTTGSPFTGCDAVRVK